MWMPSVRAALAAGLVLLSSISLPAATPDLAGHFPKDTLLYLSWQRAISSDTPVQRIESAISRVALQVPSDEAPAAFQALLGIPELWTSPAAVGLLDFQVVDDEPDVQLGGVLLSGPATGRIVAAIEALFNERGFAPGPLSDSTFGGIRYRVVGASGPGPIFAFAAHGDRVIVAVGRRAAESMAARAKGDAAGGLAEQAEFKLGADKTRDVDGADRVRFYIDVKGAVDRIKAAAGEAGGPSAAESSNAIKALGLEGIPSLFHQSATVDGAPVSRTFLHMIGQKRGLLSLWAQQPLTDDDLKIIPRDAIWATVGNVDLMTLWNNVREAIEEIDEEIPGQIDAGIATARNLLGFSITDDLLPAFGDTWAILDAPSHGGLIITGIVLVAEVRKPDAIDAIMKRSLDMASAQARAGDAGVEVALRETKIDGYAIKYVITGGKPVPVAPAWGMVGDRMVLGLSPQSVAAAMKQVDPKRRGESILDHPEVRTGRAALGGAPLSFGYADAKAFGRYLYPIYQLVFTANASAASGPQSSIDFGAIPLYAEFRAGLRDYSGYCVPDADGVIYRSSGHGQAAVLAAGTSSAMMAVMLPSLSRARELAKRSVCASNLRGIGQGLQIYSHDNGDKFPADLGELVKGGMSVPAQFVCPSGPLTEEEAREILAGRSQSPLGLVYIAGQSRKGDTRNVLVYESPFNHEFEGANVLFLDGSVEYLKLPMLKRAVSETYKRLKRESEIPDEIKSLAPDEAGDE